MVIYPGVNKPDFQENLIYSVWINSIERADKQSLL